MIQGISNFLFAVSFAACGVYFGSLSAHAAPPANDTCSGAIAIPAAGPFPYAAATISDMSQAGSAGDPNSACFGNAPLPSGVWYSFTPAVNGTYLFKTCADDTETNSGDSAITIYTGGCGAPVSPSGFCDQGGCGNHGYLSVELTAGTPYLVIIGQETPVGSVGKALQLVVNKLDTTAPSNDTCEGAEELTTASSVFTTMAGSTNNYTLNAPACFTSDSSTTAASGVERVYSFTAPTAGQYSIRARTFVDSSNLVLYATSACPASSTVSAAECLTAVNRDGIFAGLNGDQIHCYSMSAGQKIFVFVDSISAASAASPVWIDAFQCSQLEAEGNNTPGVANAISATSAMLGEISPATDRDYFALGVVAENSRIFAAIDGGASGKNDFDLRVTTATDTLEYDDSDLRVPFGDLNPVLAGVPATGVPLYLQVGQYDNDADRPYRLLHVVRPSASNATSESEPNDTIAQATSSTVGYYSGTLPAPAPSTDIDIYAFTANKGADVLVAMDAKPVRAGTIVLDSKLSVIDASGNELVAVYDHNTGEDTTPGTGSLTSSSPRHKAQGIVFRPPSTGRYYARIVAGGRTGATLTSSGGYLLSISGDSADGDADGAPDDTDGCPSDSDKASAGACGCGVPDRDDNANGVVDCLSNADLKGLLSNLLSQQKGLSLKKNDATQQARRATFTATLNAIKAYTTTSALAKITVKPSYKTLKADLKLANAAGRKALKAKTAAQLKVARTAASAAARRARKNIVG
jgi:hypothetical protein